MVDYNGIKESWRIVGRSGGSGSCISSVVINSSPSRPVSGQHLFCGTSTAQTPSTKPLSMLHANPYPKLQNQPPVSEIEPYLAILSHVRLHFWTYLDIVLLALGAHWWDVTSKRTNAAVNNYSCQRLTLMPGWNIWNYSKTYEDGKCMAQGNLVRIVFGKTFSIARSTWKRRNQSDPQTFTAFTTYKYLKCSGMVLITGFITGSEIFWNSAHLLAPRHSNSRIHVVDFGCPKRHRLVRLLGFDGCSVPQQASFDLVHLP